MGPEAIIALIGIVVSIVASITTYILGTRRERRRWEHESSLEQQRRDRELASKAADEYVAMFKSNRDGGTHALAKIGLDLLGSDALIREAIHEMELRSGRDPWGKAAEHVADIDLVEFFRFVREHRVNFFHTTVKQVVISMREQPR